MIQPSSQLLGEGLPRTHQPGVVDSMSQRCLTTVPRWWVVSQGPPPHFLGPPACHIPLVQTYMAPSSPAICHSNPPSGPQRAVLWTLKWLYHRSVFHWISPGMPVLLRVCLLLRPQRKGSCGGRIKELLGGGPHVFVHASVVSDALRSHGL